MKTRHLALGALALAVAVGAASAVAPRLFARIHPRATPGTATLHVIGTRGAPASLAAAPGKFDGVLADLARHAPRARSDHKITDLQALSPAAEFGQSLATGSVLVLVDATTRGDPLRLKSALSAAGLERAAIYGNDVGGWLPVDRLEAAASLGEVHSIRATLHRRHAGPPTSQGDFAQGSADLRTAYPSLTGAGITVGVISDSFNCYAVYAANGVPASGNQGYAANGFTADYASDVAAGALPTGVHVLAEPEPNGTTPCLNYSFPDNQGTPTGLPFTDEGRAMLQIVHDVAPGAMLAFRTGANSEADMAAGIGELQQAGARVIADDLGFYDEPFFQDGLLAQAVDADVAKGVAYFSAAGNDQQVPSYQNFAPSFGTLASSGPNAGEYLLNFDTSGATTTTALPVSLPALAPGEFVGVVVQWDQPYVTGCTAVPNTLCTGASSAIDVCISGAAGGNLVIDNDGNESSCTGPNAVGADPYQVLIVGNPANAAGNTAAQTVNLSVGLANGTPAPGQLILVVEDDGAGSAIDQIPATGPTLQGHPGAAGAAAVGAAFYFYSPRCGISPAILEAYSAAGGIPILFDTAGNRLAAPIVRQKPDFVGPDGVNNTFLGFQPNSLPFGSDGLLNTTITQCQNDPSYPNFFGTSAATPHAAGVAALLLQANGALTPAEIYTALQKSASAMNGSSPNFTAGYGFIQADAALMQIPPGAPSLTLASATLTAGSSTTITWSSPAAANCAASGSWSGTLGAAGSQSLSPSKAGSYIYTLTCQNTLGTSPASSVTLTVSDAVAGSGGGGGAPDAILLLGLAGLAAATRRRALQAMWTRSASR